MSSAHTSLGDLNQLAMLAILLEERSVTRAAKRLGMTQSALSHRLRQLRERFDDPLLVPAGRSLVPTERARTLQPPLAAALEALEEAVRAPGPFDPATSERHFVVVGTDFGEFTALPAMVGRLRSTAPGVTLQMRPPSPNIPQLLAEGDADLAIGPPLPDRPGLVQRALPEDPFVLVVRRGHPAFRRNAKRLEAYLAADHLLVVPRGAPGSPLDRLLASRGLKRRVALTVGHFTAAPFLVAQSDLVWTAQASLARRAARYVDLSIHPHPVDLPPFRGAMTWHERSHRDPGHRWLRDLVIAGARYPAS